MVALNAERQCRYIPPRLLQRVQVGSVHRRLEIKYGKQHCYFHDGCGNVAKSNDLPVVRRTSPAAIRPVG